MRRSNLRSHDGSEDEKHSSNDISIVPITEQNSNIYFSFRNKILTFINVALALLLLIVSSASLFKLPIHQSRGDRNENNNEIIENKGRENIISNINIQQMNISSIGGSIRSETDPRTLAIHNITPACLPYASKGFTNMKSLQGGKPILLTSFHGSGNTWTRLLIEASTGIYTGSIYPLDTELMQVFPGEILCSGHVAAIKGHPNAFYVCPNITDKDKLCFIPNRPETSKCQMGMIETFNRFIFVVRNPINSIFAEFQRQISGTHYGIVSDLTEDEIVDQWVSHSLRLALEIKDGWENVIEPMMEVDSKAKTFLVVRYESLVNKSARLPELTRVPSFLQVPPNKERLKCAFELSNIKSVHRRSIYNATWAMADKPMLACQLADLLKSYASKFEYTLPWSNFVNCTFVKSSALLPLLQKDKRKTPIIRPQCLPYVERDFIDINQVDIFNKNITFLSTIFQFELPYVRLLIEAATGVHSGYVYDPPINMTTLFPGGSKCGRRMSVISGELAGTSIDICPNDGEKMCIPNVPFLKKRCKVGMIEKFDRMIFLVRDPVNSVLFEFHRLLQTDFAINTISESFVDTEIIKLAETLRFEWEAKIRYLMQTNPDKLLILKYENLFNSASASDELTNVPAFVGLPTYPSRLDCAFEISFISQLQKFTPIQLSYFNSRPVLACNLWNIISSYAIQFNYSNPWAHLFDCDKLSKARYALHLKSSVVRKSCIDYLPRQHVNHTMLKHFTDRTLITSFNGGGSTWVRLLIEAATGLYTGSIYHQTKDLLGSIFPSGTSPCDKSMVAIKALPGNLEMCGKRHFCVQYGWREVRKCHQGGVREFKKTIFVARDPLHSIYAQFQRDVTAKMDGVIRELSDNIVTEWPERAIELATIIKNHWQDRIYPTMLKSDGWNFLVLKFENLVNPETRNSELRKIPEFFDLPRDDARESCAFELSDIPGLHRQSSINVKMMMRNKPALACKLWDLLKDYARNMSYSNPFPHLDCAAVECSPYTRSVENLANYLRFGDWSMTSFPTFLKFKETEKKIHIYFVSKSRNVVTLRLVPDEFTAYKLGYAKSEKCYELYMNKTLIQLEAHIGKLFTIEEPLPSFVVKNSLEPQQATEYEVARISTLQSPTVVFYAYDVGAYFNPSFLRMNSIYQFENLEHNSSVSTLMVYRGPDFIDHHSYMCWLNENMTSVVVNVTTTGKLWNAEDIRLIADPQSVDGSSIYLTYTNVTIRQAPKDTIPDQISHYSIMKVHFNKDTKSVHFSPPMFLKPTYDVQSSPAIQKNWSPFIYQKEVFFVYKFCPFTVIKMGAVDDVAQITEVETVSRSYECDMLHFLESEGANTIIEDEDNADNVDRSRYRSENSTSYFHWEYGQIRGGTPPILVNNKYYLTFFHSRQEVKPNWGVKSKVIYKYIVCLIT